MENLTITSRFSIFIPKPVLTDWKDRLVSSVDAGCIMTLPLTIRLIDGGK